MKTVVLNNEKFTITNALYESIMENNPSLLTEAPRKKRLNNKAQDEDNAEKLNKIKKQTKKSDELAKKNKSAKQKGAENILKQQVKRNENISNGVFDFLDKKTQQAFEKIKNKTSLKSKSESDDENLNDKLQVDTNTSTNTLANNTQSDEENSGETTESLLSRKPHFLGKWSPKDNSITNAYEDEEKEVIKRVSSQAIEDFESRAGKENVNLEDFSNDEKKLCHNILLLIAKEAMAYKSMNYYENGMNDLISISKDISDNRIKKLHAYYKKIKEKFDNTDGSLSSYNINFNDLNSDDLFKHKAPIKKQFELDFNGDKIKESKELKEAQTSDKNNFDDEMSNMEDYDSSKFSKTLQQNNSLPPPSAKLKDCYFEVDEEGQYEGVTYEVNSGIICKEIEPNDESNNGSSYEWKKINVAEYLVKYDPFIENYLKDVIENSNGVIKRLKHVIHSMIGILGSSSKTDKKMNQFEKDDSAPSNINNGEVTNAKPKGNSNNINYNITESKYNNSKALLESDAVSGNIKLALSGFKIEPMRISADNFGQAFKYYVSFNEGQALTTQNKKVNAMIKATIGALNNTDNGNNNKNNKKSNDEIYEDKLKQIVASFLSSICYRLIINNDNEYHMIMRVIRDDNVLNSHFSIQYLNTQQQFNVLDTVISFKRKKVNDICSVIFAKPMFAKGSKILNNFKPLVDRISSMKA